MSQFYVVVDKISDWQPYYPSEDVITFDDYLERVSSQKKKRVRIINLCRDYRYLKAGYYCSLLAEARGHNAFPSVKTINDIGSQSLSSLQLEHTSELIEKLSAGQTGEVLTFRCWFGQTLEPKFKKLAIMLFERFPTPLLEVSLLYKQSWKVKRVKAIALSALKDPVEQEAFASAFEHFSLKMWRKPKLQKQFRYDLAILIDPKEELPPSDEQALKRFEKAAHKQGMATERITRKDYLRLAEFDALFIRQTTSVNHYTYQFAKKAEAEGLVVIDDPTSILRCTNKVYLADLLNTHNIDTPKTRIVKQGSSKGLKALESEIGFPMVLKIPDGSFSRGIVKVENQQALERESDILFEESALLLAQEFMYTEYDWRIGVLNHKPLFACRYYMVSDHWQIYKHETDSTESGGFDTLPSFEAPKAVIDIALKATKLIGNGFYGVDIKQSGDRVVVIEVNDNPSIEHGVEDAYLGQQLYSEIIKDFIERIELRGK